MNCFLVKFVRTTLSRSTLIIRKSHFLQDIPMAPSDIILDVTAEYLKCDVAEKVNIGSELYLDAKGTIHILECVKEAEKRISSKNLDHEYTFIGGDPDFCDLAAKLAFNVASKIIKESLHATVQSFSGTGALRIATTFLYRLLPAYKTVWMPSPTWGIHVPIAKHANLNVKRYRYHNVDTNLFDANNCFEDMMHIPKRSIVLLHVCGHNPTGTEPNKDQWKEMSSILKKKKLFPVFDMAYLGLATGDIEADAYPDIPMGPPDLFSSITDAFKKCKSASKVNLGTETYFDVNGNIHVLECVKEAEKRIMKKELDHEYTYIGGDPDFCRFAAELTLGSKLTKEGLNATVQTFSGSGALRIAAVFLSKFLPSYKTIWMPSTTWLNHVPIAKTASLDVKRYKYHNPETNLFDAKKCFADIQKIPPLSSILIHVSGHNPTGIEPSREQWKEMSFHMKKKQLFPVIDMSYQGLISGDVEKDAYPIRAFEEDGHQFIVCQSFSTNMGLYGERVGALHVVTDRKDEAEKILSQLKIIVRPMYSSPALHGARIVKEILGDPELKLTWLKEVKSMADRIISMRIALKENLMKEGSKKNWNHITDQVGMFSYTGLTPGQCEFIMRKFKIFMPSDGRITMSGINESNVKYIAHGMHVVTDTVRPA